MLAGPDVACTASRTWCLCIVLLQGGLDFLSFLAGFPCCRDLLLRCKRVVSLYHCCFVLFHSVVESGVKKYSQNEWHLAAKLGTKLANLLQRSSLLYMSHIVGWCYYSCSSCQTLFFSVIEMFSVVKLKNSFWFAAGCAGY